MGQSNTVKPTPALPSEVLADLLPIVREINAVLDPDALLPTIAAQVRRIVDYRIMDIFLPDADGVLSVERSPSAMPSMLPATLTNP